MLLFAVPLDLDTLLAPDQYCFPISNIIDHFGSLSDHALYMTSHYMYHYYTEVNCLNLKIDITIQRGNEIFCIVLNHSSEHP